jgi:hypothetical protein
MPTPDSPDEYAEVSRYARLMLKQAGVGDRLPTPVDDIVACAELVVSQDITLEEEHEGFFTKSLGVLRSALKKAMGLVDLRENVIYLDTSVLPQKRVFVKLHESGHKVLPWQRKTLLYIDDESTLDPDIHLTFEREANRFASDVLFQADRFDRDARDLPIAIKSAMALAKRYGSSVHASLRRYVERNISACSVLVLVKTPVVHAEGSALPVKSVFQSPMFERRFGKVPWPEHIRVDHPFVSPVMNGCRFKESGEYILTDLNGDQIDCCFHLFDNSYNAFVFIYPADAQRHSRTKIIVTH